MARLRPRGSSYSNKSDWEKYPSLGIVPLRPSPPPAKIVQNLAASLIATLQEEVRCACHIEKSLYTGDTPGSVIKWAPVDASRATFIGGLGAPVNVVVSMNENQEIWAGLANGNIAILSMETQSVKNQIIHAHDAALNCIAAGTQCAWSGGDDFLIKKWDLEGNALIAYNHHHGAIRDLLILRNGPQETQVRLWGCSSDASISVATLQDNRVQHTVVGEIKTLSAHKKPVLALCQVSPDAIWSGSEDGSIAVWTSLGILKYQLQAHKGPVGSFVVMGAHVWSGSGDHTVHVWDSSSYQLLFSLGDHGGFVKAMIRVEYMCWVFAFGKNVRIWCAQSVWDTYEGDKVRLSRDLKKAKESLEKAERDRQSLEGSKQKSQQELQQSQQQLIDQQAKERLEQDKKNAELEKLKKKLAEKAEDLEKARKEAEQNKESLDDEINKLKVEKETGNKAARAKLEDVEKDLKQAEKYHEKAIEQIKALETKTENLEKDLQKARGDLENSRKNTSDLLSDKEKESKKAAELEKFVQAANDKVKFLLDELSQLQKDRVEDSKSAIRDRAEALMEFERKIKELQDKLQQAYETSSANLKKTDEERQKQQNDLKKKSKDLKKALKEAAEEKQRGAKELEDLKQIIEQLKKDQVAALSAEASGNHRLVSLTSELQTARDNLQKALSDHAQTLGERETDIQKLKDDQSRASNDLENLQAENQRLKDLIEQNQKAANAANGASDAELEKMRNLLVESSKGRDEEVNKATELGQKLQEMENLTKQLKDSFNATAISFQSLAKERDELLKNLNDAALDKEKLEKDTAQLMKTAADQALVLEEFRKDNEDTMKDFVESEKRRASLKRGLEGEQKEKLEEMNKLHDALDELNKDKIFLEDALAQATAEMEKQRLDKLSREDAAATGAEDLLQAMKDKASLGEALAKVTAELEQALQQNSRLEGRLLEAAAELEELKKAKLMQEDSAAHKAHELDQMQEEMERIRSESKQKQDDMIREMEKLRSVLKQKQDEMQKEMERLRSEFRQTQDDERLTRDSATLAAVSANLAAADAAKRIEELQNKVAKLKVALSRSKAFTNFDDRVWARIKELETALTQGHMDYRILSGEMRLLRKRRRWHRDNGPPRAGAGWGIDSKLMPGFCFEHTKVSSIGNQSIGNQGRLVKNVEVYGQTSNQGTPRRIIPVCTQPVCTQPPENSQRVISVRGPSPIPETIEVVTTPKPFSRERERYFPSHGPMRVRRGLSP